MTASANAAAGGDHGGPTAGGDRASRTRSWRLWGLLAVIAIMATLAGGWTLVNAAISGTVPLPGPATVGVSENGSPPVQVTVGPGWSELRAAGGLVLTRAGTSLTIDAVTVVGSPTGPQVWSDMGSLARVGNAGARLGPPSLVRGRQGEEGLIGRLSLPGQPAVAALFPAPGGGFVVEIVAIGKPGASAAALAAAMQAIRSVSFPGAGR